MSILGFVVDLFWLAVGILFVLGLIYIAYTQGMFGTATSARIAIIIAKLEVELTKWRAKQAAKEAKVAGVAPGDKLERVERAQALLESGAITQAQFLEMIK